MAVNYNYNLDNQQRFDQVLQGYKALAGQQMSGWEAAQRGYQGMANLADQYGGSLRTRLDQQFARQGADTQQSLISRGMGNSTILDSAQRGIGYDQANANIALNDQLLQQRLGVSSQALNHYAGVQQGLGQIGMAGLNFQGQQLNQKYGMEANYLGQQDVAAQQQGYGVQNMGYQAGIAQNQAQLNLNNQLQLMAQQNSYSNAAQERYGFF